MKTFEDYLDEQGVAYEEASGKDLDKIYRAHRAMLNTHAEAIEKLDDWKKHMIQKVGTDIQDLHCEIENLDNDNNTLRGEITELWRAIDKLTK